MTLEPLHPIQAARLREMTPAEKWNVALGLLRTARETRRAALHSTSTSRSRSTTARRGSTPSGGSLAKAPRSDAFQDCSEAQKKFKKILANS